MPLIFWIATVAMTIVALLFILRPLAKADNRGLMVTLAVAVPTVAATFYLTLGSPTLANPASPMPHQAAVAGQETAGVRQVGSVASMVGGLEARLAEDPDDGKSWLLLAQSYKYLQRMDDARDAYARAVALGQYDESLDALATGNAPAETAAAVAEIITGTISLSEEAARRVQPTDRVFIFARGIGETGAPAAVVQMPADAWPIDYRLTDANSMVPGADLSDFEQVVVTVRVTRAGDAKNALQGLEAKSPPVTVGGGEAVDLIIH